MRRRRAWACVLALVRRQHSLPTALRLAQHDVDEVLGRRHHLHRLKIVGRHLRSGCALAATERRLKDGQLGKLAGYGIASCIHVLCAGLSKWRSGQTCHCRGR